MPMEPFIIGDFSQGILRDKEPWISPNNAFRDIVNGRVFRGRLEKRSGFVPFSSLASGSADLFSVGNLLGGGFYRYQLSTIKFPSFGSVSFRSDDGVPGPPYIEADVGDGVLTWADSSSATLVAGLSTDSQNYWGYIYQSGTSNPIGVVHYFFDAIDGPQFYAFVHWPSHTDYTLPPTDDGEMVYRENPKSKIVGITRYEESVNTHSLAADPNYLYKFNASAGYYEEQGFDATSTDSGDPYSGPGGAESFTGGDDDYFWFWPFDDYILLTNGIDPVTRWDPLAATALALTEQPTDFDTSGSNDLDTALLVIRFGGRAVYLNTKESGDSFPRRARFSAAGLYDVFDSDLDYIDGPAELGAIVTAHFIGERCFVGCTDGWLELVDTGDSDQPLKWRPFISRFGASSKLSVIPDNERLLTRSKITMQSVDPNGQRYIDQSIPDLVQEFSPISDHVGSAVRNEDQRAFWWSYAPAGESSPMGILSATYDEEGSLAWSKYDIRSTVFSDFDSSQTPTWNSLGPKTWEDYAGVSWNDARVGIEGFTQVLGGKDYGMIYKFDGSSADDYIEGREPIEFLFKTQQLSPYPGQRSHVAWLDIYASASVGGMLRIRMFADGELSPHKVMDIDLTPTGSGDKVYRRLVVGRTATFHSFEGSSSDGKPWAIDGLVLWARTAGRMRVFN